MALAAILLTSILVLASYVGAGYYGKKDTTTATSKVDTTTPLTSTSTSATTLQDIIDNMPLEHLNSGHTLLSDGPLRQRSSCSSCQLSGFPAPPGGCSGSDCTVYDATTQTKCVTVSNQPPSSNTLWKAGLNLNVDQRILDGKIVAYQLQWFSGAWSGWFVPGYNDIDVKINPGCGLRRWWSYFVDHNHSYIICK